MTTEQAAAWGAEGNHSPLMNNYGSPPRLFVKGEGATLWDRDGNRHLDFLCGLAVTGLGHAHPVVTQAIVDQAATLTHTSNLFANEHQAPVAETLSRLIDSGSGQVLFQNSGAEAKRSGNQDSSQVPGPGRPRHHQRAALLSRSDPGRAGRYRPTGEARTVPAASRGFPPCCVE